MKKGCRPGGGQICTFDLQVVPILPTKVQVNWPFGSEEGVQNRFQNGGHLGFSIRMILAFFFILLN